MGEHTESTVPSALTSDMAVKSSIVLPPPTSVPAPTTSPSPPSQTEQPAPPEGGPVQTEPAVDITDECGTAGDGIAIFPFEGGYYTDVEGNELVASGQFVPIVGTTILYAETIDGYVFPDGSMSMEIFVSLSDAACFLAEVH